LEWETAFELHILGSFLFRAESRDGPRTRLNADLIPGEAASSPDGASYQFQDGTAKAGSVYHYWLEIVDTQGSSLQEGPVTVNLRSQPATLYRVFPPMIGQ
jgi:hypothetical protein